MKLTLGKTLTIGAFAAITIITGFNCGQAHLSAELASVGDPTNFAAGLPEPDFQGQTADGVTNTSGVAILTAEQVIKSMLSVSQTSSNAAINTVYLNRAGALPVSRDINKITAPMWISVTNIAGAVCAKLVTDESAKTDTTTRLFFKEINFATNLAQLDDTKFRAVVGRLARSFWSRAPSDVEYGILSQSMMTDYTAAVTTNNAAQTVLFATGLCTVMLSTFNVYTY